MTLLSEIVVQGARNTLSHALSGALSGSIAGSVSNLASRGLLSGLSFSDPGLAAAVQRAQGQLMPAAATPTPTPAPAPATPQPTEVAPVTVTAPVAPPSTGALGQVLTGAGQDVIAGGSGSDTVPASDQGAEKKDDTEVDPVTVTAPRGGDIPAAAALIPAGAAGAALLASAGGGGGAAPATEVAPLDVVAAPRPPAPPIPEVAASTVGPIAGLTTTTPDMTGVTSEEAPQEPVSAFHPEDLLLPAGVGAIAGLAAGGPSNSGVTAGGEDGGGIGGTGITPGEVIAGGILGGSLLGGVGSGGTGSAEDALKGLADKSSGLADRLGGIATAGFAGDIGGRGLNSIGRMVRKAQAAIRQRYSSMGMSGSSAELQDLQAAADAGVDLQFKVGQEMAQTGLNAIAALTGQSASIYTSLLNAQTAKNTALGNALANFAAALVH